MSNDNVKRREFNGYREGQAELCESYRDALENKINGMEKSIKFAVYFAASILGLISVSVQLYLHVIG